MTGLWRGELTPRRVAALAGHLPPGAQVYVEAGWDKGWTVGEHLAALQIDATQVQTWRTGGGKGRRPDPIPRPSDIAAQQAKQARTLAKARRYQMRHRQGGGDDG